MADIKQELQNRLSALLNGQNQLKETIASLKIQLSETTDNLNATNGAISEVSLWLKRLDAVEAETPPVVADTRASDDGVDYTKDYPKLGDEQASVN
jgi:chromosome segregation ATPase